MAGLDPAIQNVESRMRFLGLDGYRKGWVAVIIDGTKFDIQFRPNFAEAISISHDFAMVDMPIGIPATGNRTCDLQARTMLGVARSRVFTGVRRSLFGYKSQKDANAWARSSGEAGVSCQLFCILPKVVEVDAVITTALQGTIRETHPELVFARLNNGTPLTASKKTSAGMSQRIELLKKFGFDCIMDWLTRRPAHVKPDDILDACACAIAAKNPQGPIPDHIERDEKGLRMEMWY